MNHKKFVVDECTGPSVSRWLVGEEYDVLCVFTDARGQSDQWILDTAVEQQRVLVTNDKDFGEMLMKSQRRHSGVILLRLTDERPSSKIDLLRRVLGQLKGTIENRLVVATPKTVRIVGIPAS